MHSRLEYFHLATVAICGTLAFRLEAAETLYVCDESGEYGNETGLSVFDCFDGGGDIEWGSSPGAAGSVDPGDTLCIVGLHEISNANQRVMPSVSGTRQEPITIRGDCDGVVPGVLDGLGQTSRLINLESLRNFRVSGLTLRNVGSEFAISGYDIDGQFENSRNIEIENNYFENCGEVACVFAYGGGWTITANTFEGCPNDCVHVAGGFDLIFSDNKMFGISMSREDGDGLQLSSLGIDNTGNVRVSNNYCDHSARNVKYCFLLPLGDVVPGNLSVTGNTAVCPPGGDAQSCHAIHIDCKSVNHAVNISKNRTLMGRRGISMQDCDLQDGLISNNIVVSASDTGVFLDQGSDRIKVYFNTLFKNQVGISIRKNDANNHRIMNNVIYGSSVGLTLQSETQLSFNSLFRNSVDFEGSARPSEYLAVDPLLTSNLEVGSDSPVSRGGTVVPVTEDFRGRIRSGSSPSIGAFEVGLSD